MSLGAGPLLPKHVCIWMVKQKANYSTDNAISAGWHIQILQYHLIKITNSKYWAWY